jgi:hypothetical protein
MAEGRVKSRKNEAELLDSVSKKGIGVHSWQILFFPAPLSRGQFLKVFRGNLASVLPMHGYHKEIGKGLEVRIKKDLGLK